MNALRDDGCWASFAASRSPAPRPCLFLDRDGVVIVDRHHLADPAGVTLLPGAADAVQAAGERGWFVGLVTNQSGIGRGYFDWAAFARVQARIAAELAEDGAALDFVCACPHHGEGIAPYDVAGHPWRKPNAGMLLHAAEVLNVDLAASIMVGDRASDIAAGVRAGVGTCVLLGDLKGECEAAAASGAQFARYDDLRFVAAMLWDRPRGPAR